MHDVVLLCTLQLLICYFHGDRVSLVYSVFHHRRAAAVVVATTIINPHQKLLEDDVEFLMIERRLGAIRYNNPGCSIVIEFFVVERPLATREIYICVWTKTNTRN